MPKATGVMLGLCKDAAAYVTARGADDLLSPQVEWKL